MSPILVKLCDTVLQAIDLASHVLSTHWELDVRRLWSIKSPIHLQVPGEDVVFHPGEEGEKMYFVKSGTFECPYGTTDLPGASETLTHSVKQ